MFLYTNNMNKNLWKSLLCFVKSELYCHLKWFVWGCTILLNRKILIFSILFKIWTKNVCKCYFQSCLLFHTFQDLVLQNFTYWKNYIRKVFHGKTHGSLIYAIYEWLRILQNTWWRGLHGGGLHAPWSEVVVRGLHEERTRPHGTQYETQRKVID